MRPSQAFADADRRLFSGAGDGPPMANIINSVISSAIDGRLKYSSDVNSELRYVCRLQWRHLCNGNSFS